MDRQGRRTMFGQRRAGARMKQIAARVKQLVDSAAAVPVSSPPRIQLQTLDAEPGERCGQRSISGAERKPIGFQAAAFGTRARLRRKIACARLLLHHRRHCEQQRNDEAERRSTIPVHMPGDDGVCSPRQV